MLFGWATQMFHLLNHDRADPLRGLSDLSITAIRDHHWPGNGREVRSRLRRAIDAATAGWILPADIFPETNAGDSEVRTLAEARATAERHQIIRALERTDGQMAEAARLLNISRTTLWEKMQKLDL